MNEQISVNSSELKNKIAILPPTWEGFQIARQYQELFGTRSGLSKTAREELTTFSDFEYEWQNIPAGTFTAHLDAKVYVYASILKCYFRTIDNFQFQLAVYAKDDYAPSDTSISLKDARVGSWLEVKTAISVKSGKSRLSEVQLLEI